MSNFWDDYAKSYHKVSVSSAAHIDKIDYVAREINNLKCKKILDVGCGSGVLEESLFRSGFGGSVLAIDNSQEMLSIANNSVKNKKVKFLNIDLNNEVLMDGYFDAIVAINVLFYLKDQDGFLKNIRKILRKDGFFILVNPKPVGSFFNFAKYQVQKKGIRGVIIFFKFLLDYLKVMKMQKELDNQHYIGKIHYYSKEDLLLLLEKNNFLVQKCETIQAGQNWYLLSKKG